MKIHETSIIHPSSKIDDSVEIGPYCIIGEDVEIKKFEKSKGWLSKKLSSSNDQIEQLANVLDEKSVWQRYGL